ncbi:hypothetical protein [Chromobacterium alticapitis]|uniref:hypothetical protein n=1 Tax=Chromobacterium alticapitis TaxID=2073169 RepID=UPI0011B024D8|nr:hypothetical protein [Chromobacterium alticapitis]
MAKTRNNHKQGKPTSIYWPISLEMKVIIGNNNSIFRTTTPSNQNSVRPTPASQEGWATTHSTQSTPETSNSYDFTNMSPNKIVSTMNNLIKNGKLSFDDSGPLLALIPPNLPNETFTQNLPNTYDQPINVLTSLQTLIDGDKYRGNFKSAQQAEKTLQLIQSFQNKTKNIDTLA